MTSPPPKKRRFFAVEEAPVPPSSVKTILEEHYKQAIDVQEREVSGTEEGDASEHPIDNVRIDKSSGFDPALLEAIIGLNLKPDDIMRLEEVSGGDMGRGRLPHGRI